jgi:hypothetical protein
MAGFEVVVRPVVLPNIRPAPAQTLPPEDDPEKGFCTIRGNPATEVNLTTSWSTSTSKSHNVETERRFDEVRVYQMDDDGTVNQDNFVDVEVANRITMNKGKMPVLNATQIEITKKEAEEDRIREKYYYEQAQERKNNEIRKRDQIRKKEEEGGQ